jgi:hypothetical protein
MAFGHQALPCDDGGVASFARIAIPTGIETASKLKFPHRNQDITIHRAENVGTAVMSDIKYQRSDVWLA